MKFVLILFALLVSGMATIARVAFPIEDRPLVQALLWGWAILVPGALIVWSLIRFTRK